MKKIILFLILFFSFINVNAATISSNYKLYNKLSDAEKKDVDTIPEKYTNVYNNTLGAYDSKLDASGTPSFDLRDYIDIYVPNQGVYNTCYIFATMESLETTIALHNSNYYDYSVMHAEYMTLKENGGTRDSYGTGGNFRNVADYLLTGKGPVLTSEVPYTEYTSSNISSWNNLYEEIGIDGVIEYPSIDKYNIVYSSTSLTSFRNMVKEHLINEGALFSSIYAGTSTPTITKSINANEYGEYDNVLYYPRQAENTAPSNHAITIIGWDDNYPKENFPESNRPTNNGAYLILNSWGSSYSFVWVSYDDIWIEYNISGFNYENISDNKTYTTYNNSSDISYSEAYRTSDYLYSYYGDTTDSTDTIHTLYIGNKYTRDSSKSEAITEVLIPFAILSSSKEASASVYINKDNDNFSNLTYVGDITGVKTDGYYKLLLNNPVTLTGSTYAVVVKMNSVFTFRNENSTVKSYISKDNNTYSDLHDLINTSSGAYYPMVIKTLYINNYSLNTLDLIHNNNIMQNSDGIVRFSVNVNNIINKASKVNVNIYYGNEDVTSNFDILGKEIYENEALIRIKPHDNISIGYYKIKITYEDSDPIYKGLNITNTPEVIDPDLFSNSYNINYTYINYIKDKTSINTYSNNFILNNDYYKNLYDTNDEILTEGNIYTGSKLKYFNKYGTLVEEFTNVVNGDNNGNGEIDIGDIVRIANYVVREAEAANNVGNPSYVKPITFTNNYQMIASDVNHNGELDIGDIVKISNYIIHNYAIESGKEVSNPVSL